MHKLYIHGFVWAAPWPHDSWCHHLTYLYTLLSYIVTIWSNPRSGPLAIIAMNLLLHMDRWMCIKHLLFLAAKLVIFPVLVDKRKRGCRTSRWFIWHYLATQYVTDFSCLPTLSRCGQCCHELDAFASQVFQSHLLIRLPSLMYVDCSAPSP